MIKLQKIKKSYKNKGRSITVLEDISLNVESGEVFGILGRSGAGKSTLIKCINMLERPDSGNIIVDNVDMTAVSPQILRQMRQKIGVIFQGFNLLNSKTVFDNVALPLRLHGNHTTAEIKFKVDRLLHLVELTDFANKYPNSLSGGQKQRVGIARALSTDPKVLLSDEATSALDAQTTNSILELLLNINQELGLTILLITHEIDVVRKICDKVAVIDNGRIIEQGNAVDVILHPKQELTRRLIIEEETHSYLKQVENFYKFIKRDDNHLMLISFVGDKTFDPVLDTVSRSSGIHFSILRGELDHIKRMPFGQLLLEISGTKEQLSKAFSILSEIGAHYEVLA